ncbi:hypothetical protein HDU83_000643, partial [Entophlyctis luteolus]
MTNAVLFVTHAGNQPVKIETHYIGEQDRKIPLSDIADVIRDFFPAVSAAELGRYNLHLPAGVARSASGLSDKCFLTKDENDTALDPGCKLCDLVPSTLGVNSKPLIIEARN